MKKIILCLVIAVLGCLLFSCSQSEDNGLHIKVNFETYDGTEIESIDYKGGELILPEEPVLDGYTLEDWYLDEDFNELFSEDAVKSLKIDEINLYAKWVFSSYTEKYFEDRLALLNSVYNTDITWVSFYEDDEDGNNDFLEEINLTSLKGKLKSRISYIPNDYDSDMAILLIDNQSAEILYNKIITMKDQIADVEVEIALVLNAVFIDFDNDNLLLKDIELLNGFYYIQNEEECLLLKYKGTEENLEVPRLLNDKTVKLDNYAFAENESIKNITFEEGFSLSKFPYGLFENCTSLVSVALPSDVTKIEEETFSGCTNLTTVSMPSGVTSIGRVAFNGCSSIQSFILPQNLETIGYWAFSGCSLLESIVIPDSVTYIGDGTFSECSDLKSVKLSENLDQIEMSLFNKCYSLESIVIPNKITEIKGASFSNCHRLTEVTFVGNSTLSKIRSSSFYYCTALREIVIPMSVTEIENDAFQGSNPIFYCETAEKPAGWGDYWKKPESLAIWGCGIEKTFSFNTNGGSAVSDIVCGFLNNPPETTKEGFMVENWYDNSLFEGEPIRFPYCFESDTTLYAKWCTNYDETFFSNKLNELNQNYNHDMRFEDFYKTEFEPTVYDGFYNLMYLSYFNKISVIIKYDYYINNILNANIDHILIMNDLKSAHGLYIAAKSAWQSFFYGSDIVVTVKQIGKLVIVSYYDVNLLTYDILTENNYKYMAGNDFSFLMKYIGNEENITIPSEIGGKTLKFIADSAFYDNDNLKQVNIYNNIDGIGSKAFQDCNNLEIVNLFQYYKDYAEWGDDIFKDCSIISIYTTENRLSSFKSCFGYNIVFIMPTVTLIFGENENEVIEVPYNTIFAEPEEPIKEGFVFSGWYIDSDCTMLYDFTTAVTSDMILYAKWE